MIDDVAMSIQVQTGTLAVVISRLKQNYMDNSSFKGQTRSTVGGQAATKLSFVNTSDGGITPTIYLIEKNNKIYVIGGEGSNKDSGIDAKVIKMISTFQFIQ